MAAAAASSARMRARVLIAGLLVAAALPGVTFSARPGLSLRPGLRTSRLSPARASPRLGAEEPPTPPPARAGSDADAAPSGGVREFVRDNLLQGIEPSADVAAILACYFVQGALGLARLATTFYLKDEMHLSPAEVAALAGVFTLPWVIKPLYGFVTDGFPLFGYRRRSYLALAGLLSAASYAALATGLPSAEATVGAVVAGSLGIAVSDVVADSMVVERARELSAGAADREAALSGTLQSLCWSSRAVGSIGASYASGWALQLLGAKPVFGLTALLPLAVTASAAFVDEARVPARRGAAAPPPLPPADAPLDAAAAAAAAPLRAEADAPDGALGGAAGAQARLLWSAVRRPEIWQPALFIFAWMATPSADSAFLYFLTDELHISQEFLGRISLGASIASLGGISIYQRYLREVPVPTVLLGASLASAAFGLVQLVLVTHANRALGLPDEWFAFGDDVVLTVIGQFAHMPTLVLAARLCPPGVEGTLFALLMSVYNLGGTVGTEIGAALTSALGVGVDGNYDRLGLLVTLCSLSTLLPLPFLRVLERVPALGDDRDGGRSDGDGPGADHTATSSEPPLGRGGGDDDARSATGRAPSSAQAGAASAPVQSASSAPHTPADSGSNAAPAAATSAAKVAAPADADGRAARLP